MNRTFCFPLKQHIGEAAAHTIVKDDKIVRGQLLAVKGENSLGANLYSSVSGIVTEVTNQQITIFADEKQSEEYRKLKSDSPLKLIEESGLVGLGGAGFPTYKKLSTPFKSNGMVIVNAVECEPILSHNLTRVVNNPAKLIRGLTIAMEIVNAKEGVIAIKEKHQTAIRLLQEILPDNMRLYLLKDQYPMGEERAILREVKKKLLDVTSIPFAAGAIVLNAETVCRIQEAVDLKKPFIDKDITVAGKLLPNKNSVQTFLDVPLGMNVRDCFQMAGGLKEEYGELIMGGPFTGKRTSMEAPIIKTTGGLIATECFMQGPKQIGLLACACGADMERLREIAKSLGSEVVGEEYCKQAVNVNGHFKCGNPGICPGQAQKILSLKKAGSEGVLISNCTDCSNTVMSCAPNLGLKVFHCTDGALRAVNHPLVRKMRI